MRTIWITGCSSGIGLHAARTLHDGGGWRVIASARRAEDLERLRDGGLTAVHLDLDDSASINRALAETLRLGDGRLDALFNNAGYGQPGAVEDISRAAMRAQFETNVFGLQELTNAVVPIMRSHGGGRIIHNSSVLGYVSLKYRGAYNASKHALEALADTQRMELAGSGVHLVLIEPGPVESRFRANAMRHFALHVNAAKSFHADTYRAMREAWEQGTTMPFTVPPGAVTRALIRALESPRPAWRYRVTVPSHLFWYLRRILPMRWLYAILSRA